jgi:His/Glu/Gln/Arg/opine family amino acid ABC transporter permease subunit
MRENLFSSWLDTALTIGSVLLVVSLLLSFLQWIVGQANWFAVTFNIRQFMIWRYPQSAEWRIQFFVLFLAVVVGVALAAWARVPRWIVIAIIVGLALLFVVPLVIDATVPMPPSYVTAGDVEVVSGSSTQTPQPQLAFIARGGETFSVGLAQNFSNSDEQLAVLHSFGDNASNLLLNAAANRLTAQARIAELNALLATDALTNSQRTALQTELDGLQVPPPVVETYTLNQSPVTIRLLRGTTLEVLAEETLEAGSAPLTVTLPEDGWYVLEKTVAGEGAALLQVNGLFPLFQRSFTRTGVEIAEGEETTTPTSARILQYIRMTDKFLTEAVRPAIEGEDVPMAIIIDNQYRGTRTLPDFLRVYLSPFLQLFNLPFLLIFIAAVVGYFVAKAADQFWLARGKVESGRRVFASHRMATWLLIASPVVMFVLIHGFFNVLPLTDTRLWGGLMLTFLLTAVGIIGSFPIGVLLALGRRSSLPVVAGFCTLFIEFVRGVPLIAVLFMAVIMLPFANPALAEIDDAFTVMVGIILFSAAYLAENVRGGLQSVPHGQEEAAKAVGLANWQIVLYITLPQALRAVIPALVGQSISLFKDTSLVAIVGLSDLTRAANSIVSQTEFIGTRRETFVFITVIYFVISYIIAYISRRIEATGVGAARRV